MNIKQPHTRTQIYKNKINNQPPQKQYAFFSITKQPMYLFIILIHPFLLFPHTFSWEKQGEEKKEHSNYPVLQIWKEFKVLGRLEVTGPQVRSGNSIPMAMTRTPCFPRHFGVYYCISSSWWRLVEVAWSSVVPRANWTQRGTCQSWNCVPPYSLGLLLLTTLLAQVLVWVCKVGLYWNEYPHGEASESGSRKGSEPMGKEKSLQYLRSSFLNTIKEGNWMIWHIL